MKGLVVVGCSFRPAGMPGSTSGRMPAATLPRIGFSGSVSNWRVYEGPCGCGRFFPPGRDAGLYGRQDARRYTLVALGLGVASYSWALRGLARWDMPVVN